MLFKLNKMRIWSFLLITFISLGLLFNSGCSKLQELAEAAIEKIEAGEVSELFGSESLDSEIRGQVYYTSDTGSNTGASYASVTVKLLNLSGVSENEYYTSTDSDGYFTVLTPSLSNLSGVTVEVGKGGFKSASYDISFGTGEQYSGAENLISVRISLTEDETATDRGSIRGTVTYQGVIPVSGAKIIVSGEKEATSYTNQMGEYIITNLVEGSYSVTVERDDFDKANPVVVALSMPSNMQKSDLNFSISPTTSKQADYNIEGLGVIYAQFIKPGNSDGSENAMPPFITQASVRLIDVLGPDGKDKKTFVNRSDLSFKFFGIPIGDYTVEAELVVDMNKLDTSTRTFMLENVQRLTQRYSGIQSKQVLQGVAPELQKIIVEEDDFGLDDYDFGGDAYSFNTIYIEQHVSIRTGHHHKDASNAYLRFEKDGSIKDATADIYGNFGLELPSSGEWT